jgi:glutathione S-transferase
MTLKLISLSTDSACAMIGKILDFKGLDYEVVDAEEDQPEEIAHSSDNLKARAEEPAAKRETGKRLSRDNPANPARKPDQITQHLPALTFPNGETTVGAWEIIARLETEHPEPTLLPASYAGLHQVLARYFEGELGATVLRAAMPELLDYYRARGPRPLSRYVRWVEQRMAAGFCARARQQAEANRSLMRQLLAPLEDELRRRAFLLGRIGLADFALYGQLRCFACAGKLKLPEDFTALREHFMRIDRITARLEAE